MKKSLKLLYVIVASVILYTVACLAVVHYIDSTVLMIQLLLFLTLFAAGTNAIIVILSIRTILFAVDAEEVIESSAEKYAQMIDEFEQAGITAKKVAKFEPLIDVVGDVIEKVDPDKIGNAMEKTVDMLDELDGDPVIERLDIDEVFTNDEDMEEWYENMLTENLTKGDDE